MPEPALYAEQSRQWYRWMYARVRENVPYDQIVAGFAGGTADALTLFEKFEEKLDSYGGNLGRAAALQHDSSDDQTSFRHPASFTSAVTGKVGGSRPPLGCVGLF